MNASSLTSVAEVVPGIRLTVSAANRRAPVAELLLCSAETVLRALPDECVAECVWLPLVLARGSAAVCDAVLARLRSAYGSAAVSPGFSKVGAGAEQTGGGGSRGGMKGWTCSMRLSCVVLLDLCFSEKSVVF